MNDEIAVDLPYRNLVISHLMTMDANENEPCAGPGESDRRLDLGLVTLRAAARTAARFASRYGKPSTAGKPSEIDIILHGLRRDIGVKYGGWLPRMGKVRNADVVGGLPHTGSNWEYPESAPDDVFQLRPGTAPEGRGVTVGVLDGRMYPHPELKGRWRTPDQESQVPEDDSYPWLLGHAAFVMGRLLDRAPGARPLVRGVLRSDVPRATVWDVAKAMADALDDGVAVLNLSLGCYTADGQPPFVLNRAVEVLSGHGVAVVAAAGNHGGENTPPGITPNAPIFPAACPGAVAVGAFTTGASSFEPAPFSPRAPWISLGAPGHRVPSTYLFGRVLFGEQLPGLPPTPPDMTHNGYAIWSGTSFATAAVTGEIARIMSSSGMTPMEVVAELRETNPLGNSGIGWYARP
jgi:membrane-anchored mycosin MYCP